METTLTKSENTTKYNVDVALDENNLNLTVLDVQQVNNENNNSNITNTNNVVLKEEAKAVFEGNLVPISLLSQNINTVDTISNFLNKNSISNVNTFGDVSTSNFYLDSGSHVSIDSFNLVSGFSFNLSNNLNTALFLEYGKAKYETVNEFMSGLFLGNGDAYFIGGGLFAKYNLINTFNYQAYFDAHISSGAFSNNWFADNSPLLNYNLKSKYYTSHIGLGIVYALSNYMKSELYSKYFYSNVSGNNVMVGDDLVSFDNTESLKLRLGTKLSIDVNNYFSNYLGFNFDFENKNVDASGFVNELPLLNNPNVNGNSFAVEYGMAFSNADKDWKVNLNFRKSFGKISSSNLSAFIVKFW